VTIPKKPQQIPIVGIDTGGTFTDFVVYDERGLRSYKTLSTPDAPERAILSGLKELGLLGCNILLRHGSTVATNALLEGKGVRTAYISNQGFADVLTIGRQARDHLYTLSVADRPPPVPPELCFETGGRLSAQGEVLQPLSDADLADLKQKVSDAEVQAVAVNLLFSYLDADFEQQIKRALPDQLFVCLSSDILAEIGEYERAVATWLNAYVGPKMASYLKRLSAGAKQARISVMQSDGLSISAEQASERAVNLLLSGPAGGLMGARQLAAASGFKQIMTLDVGGTSSDVALIDGDLRITRNGRIGRYPVAVPMVDMHTVGAGGGSIASIDAAGMLRVGPESAGADPGPACYGKGGTAPTLTDANLILGRLPKGLSLGGGIGLDLDRALSAFKPLAEKMHRDVYEAARGVVAVANETMAGALRVISVERGYDPADFVLCGFGGAGGLHGCELAELLGMKQALIPQHAGVLSALGMAISTPGRERTRTHVALLNELESGWINTQFEQIGSILKTELMSEIEAGDQLTQQYSLDLRYQGQSFTLSIPWTGLGDVVQNFHRAHQQRYGHRFDFPIEMVNFRVRIKASAPKVALAGYSGIEPSQTRPGLQWRSMMETQKQYPGPLIIVDPVGSTWVHDGWTAKIDAIGNLLLQHQI